MKFKKGILMVAMAFLATTAVNAQEFAQFGIKGGVNFSTFTGDGIRGFEDPDMRTGFHLGLLAEIPLADKFSIQPEVLYSAQGFDLVDDAQDNLFDIDDNVEYQVDYITVPVLAKIYLVEGLSVQAGPSFNFKVNEEIDSAPLQDGGDTDVSDVSAVKDFEFGGVAGLEYKFNNGFFIQGRYNYGFTDLIEDYDVHNSVFQAGVGYMF
ncbi:porin family protein [Salegentibacter sp. F188]|uniref:Porin family protein n=1 Tax=Autumnicola patrickiae TaxID=3075591 RepID=A0ABU3E707_9FLAO|nr:porin family protein [Salegentibacter sp. F188]MDT0691781.1 porin family protein [Salegentibacter sp. F188]